MKISLIMAFLGFRMIITMAGLVNYGFMALDGRRGLLTGDYFRPKTGKP